MDREMIQKLAELSMIDIDNREREDISKGIEELLEKLTVVKLMDIKENCKLDERRTEIMDDSRKREDINIEDVNKNTKEGYIKVQRTVGD